METSTAVKSAAMTAQNEQEPVKLLKRIGSTVYTVNAYFSENANETLADKILRLARNDGLDFQSKKLKLVDGRLSQERSAV